MKKQTAAVARALLVLVALVVVQGCTTFQNRLSGKSWGQTAEKEQQQQQLYTSPQDGWSVLP